ncbi:hypothetical protein, partial [Inquilinus limosus]|uniref:hypothetical protein n=1 Tax=Inquilinus limosus TaxID=171674 RepID=UPI001EE727E4
LGFGRGSTVLDINGSLLRRGRGHGARTGKGRIVASLRGRVTAPERHPAAVFRNSFAPFTKLPRMI